MPISTYLHKDLYKEVGRKLMAPQLLQFKQMVDPYGLMNPGKVRALQTAASR